MLTRTMKLFLLFSGLASSIPAGVITLENTIPSGSLFLQPPLLTGAGALFGTGGTVVADAFTASASASLSQISVVVQHQDFLAAGITGRSSLLLTLLTDSGNSPGAPIESWTVALSASTTNLTIVTVDSVINSLLLAGHQYWLSEVPTDPIHTGIGWALASSSLPGVQLPIAESTTGVNGGWGPTSSNIANEFSVTGVTIPEPATYGVCALILLAMLLAGRSFTEAGNYRTQTGVYFPAPES